MHSSSLIVLRLSLDKYVYILIYLGHEVCFTVHAVDSINTCSLNGISHKMSIDFSVCTCIWNYFKNTISLLKFNSYVDPYVGSVPYDSQKNQKPNIDFSFYLIVWKKDIMIKYFWFLLDCRGEKNVPDNFVCIVKLLNIYEFFPVANFH